MPSIQLFTCGCVVTSQRYSSKLTPCDQHKDDATVKNMILNKAAKLRRVESLCPISLQLANRMLRNSSEDSRK
jgi:hypothetical protein